MARVIVNGKTYQCESGSINVINNRVYCNGKLVSDTNELKEKDIRITIEENVGNVSLDSGYIDIKGTADNVSTQSGDISVGMDVLGECKTVSGDINIRGNAYNGCKTVSGDISATYIAKNPRDVSESMRRSYIRPDIQTGQINYAHRHKDYRQEESLGTLFVKEIKTLYKKSKN